MAEQIYWQVCRNEKATQMGGLFIAVHERGLVVIAALQGWAVVAGLLVGVGRIGIAV